jgi:hypothetical protein
MSYAAESHTDGYRLVYNGYNGPFPGYFKDVVSGVIPDQVIAEWLAEELNAGRFGLVAGFLRGIGVTYDAEYLGDDLITVKPEEVTIPGDVQYFMTSTSYPGGERSNGQCERLLWQSDATGDRDATGPQARCENGASVLLDCGVWLCEFCNFMDTHPDIVAENEAEARLQYETERYDR